MTPRPRGRPRISPSHRGQLVHLRLDPVVYRALKARALADGRSLTKECEFLLREVLMKGRSV